MPFARGLMERSRRAAEFSLDKAFSAFTADVIHAQLFGAVPDYFSDPDLSVPWRDAFISLSAGFHVSRFIPNLLRMLKKLSFTKDTYS